jgi:hypothetical protein
MRRNRQMPELKESETLAEKLTVRSVFEISTKSVLSFDALMVEIQKKQEEFPQFSMDIIAEWETMNTKMMMKGSDKRILKIQDLPSESWGMFVSRIRAIENEIITYLNESNTEDQPKTVPIFSCNVKLKIEKKDKEAQKALEDPNQLQLFAPMKPVKHMNDQERKQFVEDNKHLFESIKPDGKDVSSVTFQKIGGGEPIELKAK